MYTTPRDATKVRRPFRSFPPCPLPSPPNIVTLLFIAIKMKGNMCIFEIIQLSSREDKDGRKMYKKKKKKEIYGKRETDGTRWDGIF